MIVSISTSIGSDLRTRSFFRRDIEKLISNNSGEIIMDFSEVRFISRSVADEICNVLSDHPNLSAVGMLGDVYMMFSVVRRGREQPRIYPTGNIKVIDFNTLDEMDEFFSSR